MAAAAAWSSGTLGMRAPLRMPETTVVTPALSVEVTVERSLESV